MKCTKISDEPFYGSFFKEDTNSYSLNPTTFMDHIFCYISLLPKKYNKINNKIK